MKPIESIPVRTSLASCERSPHDGWQEDGSLKFWGKGHAEINLCRLFGASEMVGRCHTGNSRECETPNKSSAIRAFQQHFQAASSILVMITRLKNDGLQPKQARIQRR